MIWRPNSGATCRRVRIWAYMEMVLQALYKNPDFALMGACVLVMLMKDQNVYVMNHGDSRVILAQERPNDRYPNQTVLKDDLKYHNRSRESLVHMELDSISKESPMYTQSSQVNKINKSKGISFCRLKMRALQLSTDHSTNSEENVMEHHCCRCCLLLSTWVSSLYHISLKSHLLLNPALRRRSLRTLRDGKLTEKILKLFIASGKDEILLLIQALNTKHIEFFTNFRLF